MRKDPGERDREREKGREGGRETHKSFDILFLDVPSQHVPFKPCLDLFLIAPNFSKYQNLFILARLISFGSTIGLVFIQILCIHIKSLSPMS